MNIWELQSACNGETIIWSHSVQGWCGIASMGEYDVIYQLKDDLWDRYNPEHAESYIAAHTGIATVRNCDSPQQVLAELETELEALKDAEYQPVKKYVSLDDTEKLVSDWVDRDHKPATPEQIQKSIATVQILSSAASAIRAVQRK